MSAYYYQRVCSKMKKTKIYQKNIYIKPYIPETIFLNTNNLAYMLNKYPMVVFKPNIGERGIFVGSISRTSVLAQYDIHYLTDIHKNLYIDEVINFISKLAPKKRFLLQQGIDLIKYQHKPVDIRAVVQKPYACWLVTGYIARIAADNKMVTNLDSGGKGLPLNSFLKSTNLTKQEIAKLKKSIIFISKNIANTLTKRYPDLRELGVDFGVDNNLYPWVLEVNTWPGYWRFKYFKDKSLYYKIHRNHKIIVKSSRNKRL